MEKKFSELVNDTISPDELGRVYGGVHPVDEKSACITNACKTQVQKSGSLCDTAVCYSQA